MKTSGCSAPTHPSPALRQKGQMSEPPKIPCYRLHCLSGALCPASVLSGKALSQTPCYQSNQFSLLFFCVLGLLCCTGFPLVVVSRGYSSLSFVGLSLWRLLLLGSTGFSSCGTKAPSSWFPGSGGRLNTVVHRLSCSTACGIFPDQGSNWYLLHWQADSLPLSHHRSSSNLLLISLSILIYVILTFPLEKAPNFNFSVSERQFSKP